MNEGSPKPRSLEEFPSRLETYLVFIRHGKAEKLEGADTDEKIDAKRHHTKEGEAQVYAAGQRLGEEIDLRPNDVIFKRSSDRERAKETVEGVAKGFLDAQRARGVTTFKSQESKYREKKGFSFPVKTSNAYEPGGKRRGTTSGLSEEWVRSPDLFAHDIAEAGLDEDAVTTLKGKHDEFQNVMALMDRAGKFLKNRYEVRSKQNQDDESMPPPRLIILAGSHGFVSEAWLKDVVAEYEKQNNRQIPIELGYGQYFTVHFPPNPGEPVILSIGKEKIPIKEEFLERIKQSKSDEQ